MSCNGSSTSGPAPVWTNKTTNSWLFHPLAPPESSVGVNSVRPTLEVSQSSGAIKVRPALRYSSDLGPVPGAMIQSRHDTRVARVMRLVGCQRQFARTVCSNSSHLPLLA